MKIIYLSTSTVPSKSANSIHVMKMCQAFAKGGHDVTLITQKKAKTEFISDYEYYGVQPLFKIKKYRSLLKRGSLYITALQATLFSLKNRPDIVYGRNIFGCLLSSFLGIPTIVELHQPPEEVGIGIGKYFLKLLVSLKNLKKIVVISEALKKHISATYRVEDTRIRVAHDGADAVEQISSPAGKTFKNVGYVGHLYKGRGIDLIIKLARRCRWAEFHIVGGRKKDVRFWENKIGGRCRNIKFYGFISPGKIKKLSEKFDVLLAPYQRKVYSSKGDDIARWLSPLKIFEYMSWGKPIIASDLPVLKEVLVNNENAVLAPPDNAEEWVRVLERLKEDERLREKLGRQARKDLETKYTWDARASKVIGDII